MSFHVTASRAVALGTTFCLTAGLGGLVSPTASVATVNQISYGPNGSINALLADGVGGAYVGGNFDGWGYQTGGLAAISRDVPAAPDLTFPDVDGIVSAIEPDGEGGFFLGGNFDEVGGEDRENLAHIDAEGNVTDWAPETSGDGIHDDTDGAVFTLELHDGVVFAGGRFLRVWDEDADDFRTQPLAAAFDADSAAVSNWNPGFSGDGSGGWFNNVNEGVWDFHILGTTLYVGGAFIKLMLPAPAVVRSGIAAFDLTSLTNSSNGLTTFAPNPDGPVLAMVTSPAGELLIGGIFENVGAAPVRRMSLAEIDADDAQATTFNVPVTSIDSATVYPGQVEAVAVSGTNILIGGWFDEVGGEPRPNLALVSSGGVVNVWNPAPDAGVEAIAVSGDSYYVAGSFSNIDAHPREGVAKFNSLIFESAWDPGVDDSVSAISVTDSGVLIGGRFSLVDTTTAQQLVRVTSSGTLDGSFEADSSMETGFRNEEVTALETWSGELAVARTGVNSFTRIAADSLEWLNPSSGAATSRLPFVPNGAIETLVAGARLYAGGSFTSVDPPGAASAEARTYGFGVLSDGELLAAWAPAFAGPVEQLHIAGDFVYAVGEGPRTGAYFDGTPFAVRAATLEDGELDNTWSVDFSLGGTAQYGQVFGIAAWTGGLAIGGRMLTGTVSDDGLSLLGVSAVDASITWRSSINGRSRAIALVPRTSSLIVGGTGSLNSSNTFSPPDDLSILDQPTPPATRTTWLPEAPSDVNAVVISGSNLFVGGRSGLLITPVPVDNPNGGGGGSSETPSVTTSTAETITTETQAFGPDTSLTLRPGEVAILLNGTRVPALGTPGVGNRSLVVTGDGTSLTVPSPAGLGGSGAPQWQPGFSTSLNASGFQPGMVVDTYLLSSPQLIGSVSATLTGAGSIAITVPATMKMGSHTLQVVGKDSRGRSLIIAVGLTVEKAPKTMGTRVYFPIGSSKLTKSAKATLRSMINRVKAEGMLSASARVSGLVRPTGTKASDIQLAKKRARTVSAYMKSDGFTGNIQPTTKAPVGDRWSDRRVHISIKL